MISKRARWALLGVGFIALGGTALLTFDKIEIWYRGRVKQQARAKVEELLTGVMEQTVLPPIKTALAASSLCRNAAGCELESAWSYLTAAPEDTRFTMTANRTLSLPSKDGSERVDFRFQVGLETVSALEFMDNPTLFRRQTSLHTSVRLYAPEAGIKAGRLDPAQRALAASVGKVFARSSTLDFDRQVIEPCLKRQSVQMGDGRQSIKCVLRQADESMSSYLKRSRGEKPDGPRWYLDIDLRQYYSAPRPSGSV